MSVGVNEWRIGAALALAQLQATVARADAGSGNSRLVFYSSPRPETLADLTGAVVLAEVVLAKPCGTVTDGVLSLQPQDAAGTLVVTAGIPRWAVWWAADGSVITDGGVTDATADGCFRVTGGDTAEGDNSPMFYAGSLMLLAGSELI